eukprot:7506542-Alexandrium_andersonii.AAC.1
MARSCSQGRGVGPFGGPPACPFVGACNLNAARKPLLSLHCVMSERVSEWVSEWTSGWASEWASA